MLLFITNVIVCCSKPENVLWLHSLSTIIIVGYISKSADYSFPALKLSQKHKFKFHSVV